jgi:hypothetical protein
MVLIALYVCLLHYSFVKNHPNDLEVTNPSLLRQFCHSWYQSQIGAKYTH